MNGKTAEIINTDAEGRLILADALCYAEKYYKPDVILDIATLTGACLYALGHFYAGFMSFDKKIISEFKKISDLTGDRVWELPFIDDYRPAIESDVADLANCGKSAYKGGTITAGLFLSNFVEKTPWAHIDIAGTADSVPGINYVGKGATGAGVRMLVEFILNYK
jgi:leucyl aminopeptidase